MSCDISCSTTIRPVSPTITRAPICATISKSSSRASRTTWTWCVPIASSSSGWCRTDTPVSIASVIRTRTAPPTKSRVTSSRRSPRDSRRGVADGSTWVTINWFIGELESSFHLTFSPIPAYSFSTLFYIWLWMLSIDQSQSKSINRYNWE